ncbi:hypothetical protein T459_11528 [Capsicum annuum]|uniref:Thaumatin-like protein 1 n=1 Tax=Capsicum annuum TaxID=4072 RepID=A0A2G2ZMB9_CAPAN|nr:hypothetical protein T459_11528 [Capsicum annuum]
MARNFIRCRLCTTCSNRIPAKSWPVCFHPIPTGWSGRLWGRTFCSQDSSTGKFACATDFYDVSLVHGYNLPILVSPQGGTGVGGVGNCSTTGCVGDLNEACPKELKKMMDSHSSNNSSNSECV